MNILFLLKSFDVGGVEMVTSVIANKFAQEGHHVVLWAFYKHEPTLEDKLNPNVKVVYGYGFNSSMKNVTSLVKVMNDYHIDIIINQWALPHQTTSLFLKAIRLHPAKVISVHHSAPSTNGRLMDLETMIQNSSGSIRIGILKLKRMAMKIITSYSMRRCYKNSDMFVVLADSYKQQFSTFIGVESPEHIVSIPNPLTIDNSAFLHQKPDKEKRILYVGRLENKNKKPERALNVWSRIVSQYPEWQLDIVGDGPSREELESYVNEKGIERVTFWGFRNPKDFYSKASLLLLTSDFEGFPLVLTEAMSFGVVPVVYGSFSAVYDIIDDGENGLIIKKTSKGFDPTVMADSLSDILVDTLKRDKMSACAIKKSMEYSIDTIYQQWIELFNVVS